MKTVVKSKRMRMEPMTDSGMRVLIDSEHDMHMKQAYASMLSGCMQNPKARNWYAAWQIKLLDGTQIGDVCYKGSPVHGAVEIGYGIAPKNQNQGFASEMVEAMVGWAFAQPDVYFVIAETELENAASQRVLEKAAFRPDGAGVEGPRFIREKDASNWMLMYMVLGMGVGIALGANVGQSGIGIGLGMGVGIALGAALDAREKASREKHRAARNNVEKQ